MKMRVPWSWSGTETAPTIGQSLPLSAPYLYRVTQHLLHHLPSCISFTPPSQPIFAWGLGSPQLAEPHILMIKTHGGPSTHRYSKTSSGKRYLLLSSYSEFQTNSTNSVTCRALLHVHLITVQLVVLHTILYQVMDSDWFLDNATILFPLGTLVMDILHSDDSRANRMELVMPMVFPGSHHLSDGDTFMDYDNSPFWCKTSWSQNPETLNPE